MSALLIGPEAPLVNSIAVLKVAETEIKMLFTVLTRC